MAVSQRVQLRRNEFCLRVFLQVTGGLFLLFLMSPVKLRAMRGAFFIQLMSRRFPPPWSVEEQDACYVVRDHDGQQLAYVYFEDEPGRRSAANRIARQAGRLLQFLEFYGSQQPLSGLGWPTGISGMSGVTQPQTHTLCQPRRVGTHRQQLPTPIALAKSMCRCRK